VRVPVCVCGCLLCARLCLCVCLSTRFFACVRVCACMCGGVCGCLGEGVRACVGASARTRSCVCLNACVLVRGCIRTEGDAGCVYVSVRCSFFVCMAISLSSLSFHMCVFSLSVSVSMRRCVRACAWVCVHMPVFGRKAGVCSVAYQKSKRL